MYRMMIVDDEERIANSIYDLMDERFDFELYRCYSAMAALDVIRTMRFDIVITDIAMPGMSGLELLNKVQAIWPKCHFLILTAYDSFDYAYETLRHDRVDYLLKIESYDTICQCVERKLQDIQKERSREEKLRHYEQYVQQVGESMGRYFLKRIIVQGIPLPDQHDLDQFSVPLRLDQPVMLVFLALNDQNPVTNNRTSMDILQSIQARFQAYDIPFLSYLSTGTILLVIQPGGESNLAGDRITYVQTALENLPQTVEEETGRKLAILCADAPILWQQAHTLYQRAAVRLEDIRSESGMMVLDTAEELRHSDGELFFPSMEELNMLWEMVKCGNIDSFLRVLRDELDTAGFPALPETTVAAVGYLLTEAGRLYAPRQDIAAEKKRLTACEHFGTLDDWLAAITGYLKRIRQTREENRESRETWLIVRINQYIEQHYQEDLTLTMLADEVHYSPAYLSRFYKANTGTNVMTHLYNVRIGKAKELLENSNDKVSDIAIKTGFCSTKYFNRVFKKMTGLSPAQFRRDSVDGPSGN